MIDTLQNTIVLQTVLLPNRYKLIDAKSLEVCCRN